MHRQIEGRVGWLAESKQLPGHAHVGWQMNCLQHTKFEVTTSQGRPFHAPGTLDLPLCLGGKERWKIGPCLPNGPDPPSVTKETLALPIK